MNICYKHQRIGQAGVCGLCLDELIAVNRAAAEAEVVAKIVAWLRAGGPAPRDATRWPCDSFADAIEGGEWKK